ncbi:MAG TPA: RodZ domain-containing protein [Spirochaetia bacterium]|nr:RodZ domain-containing protein [Spirochaetia bacterium]
MESIGEKLRLARERNNLTIEQVARETHVAKRFLKALEDEDFATFPGETYAMGFLRNYAEYLGLNPEELVAIYRNIKIQEQPLPMSELLESKTRAPSLRVILFSVAAVLAIAAVGYLVYRATAHAAGPDASGQKPTAGGNSTDLVFQDDVRTQWFSQGDAIVVPVGGKNYRVVVFAVGDTLTLKVPGGTVDLGLGKERYIDLDGDSTPDLRVVWNDVDRAAPVKRVNLGLYRTTGQAAAATDASGAIPAATGGPAPSAPADTFKPLALAQAAQAGLFTLDFTFKNDCYFRYSVDAGDREDRFFQKGEQFSIDTARKQVTIWLSNAGAARLRVQGRDFELGDLGEVATRRIAWQPDASSGGYVLQITPLY